MYIVSRYLPCYFAVWSEKFKSVVSWNAQLQERCTECVLSNKVHTFGIASVSLLSVLNSAHVNILPLLNRPKPLDFRTSSQILLLSPQQPLVEPLDRFKKLQEDSFTFYSGPEHSRDKKRKILSSAYLASSAAYSELPRHMGSGKSSVLLVRPSYLVLKTCHVFKAKSDSLTRPIYTISTTSP